jgi:hypothetical protein
MTVSGSSRRSTRQTTSSEGEQRDVRVQVLKIVDVALTITAALRAGR